MWDEELGKREKELACEQWKEEKEMMESTTNNRILKRRRLTSWNPDRQPER